MSASSRSGRDRLVVIARDPTTLFAYWELGGSLRPRLSQELGSAGLASAQWILRLTQLATGATLDIRVDPQAGNWYMAVQPGTAYESEFGLRDAHGGYRRLLAGGRVCTPPASFSSHYDRQWMVLEEDYLRLLAMGWTGPLGSFATSPGRREEPPAADEPPVGPPAGPEAQPSSPGVPGYTGRR